MTTQTGLKASILVVALVLLAVAATEASGLLRGSPTSPRTDPPTRNPTHTPTPGPTYTPSPTPTPTPTPTPDIPTCSNMLDTLILAGRPIFPQTDNHPPIPDNSCPCPDSLRQLIRIESAIFPQTDGPRPPAPDDSGCSDFTSPVGEGDRDSDGSANCLVTHAATPAQLCPGDSGYQYYYIGPEGTQTGPLLSLIDALATSHPPGSPLAELYRGQNPMTNKPVRIDYLPDEAVLRISTFYADTPNSSDKPYVFTVDENNEVTHLSW